LAKSHAAVADCRLRFRRLKKDGENYGTFYGKKGELSNKRKALSFRLRMAKDFAPAVRPNSGGRQPGDLQGGNAPFVRVFLGSFF